MTDQLETEIQRLSAELEKNKKELKEAKHLIKRNTIELKAVMAQADEVSHIDALTCLPNRRQIIKNLQNEVNRAERYNSILSISMIDLDHFKQVNDSYGHTVGDQVLYQLATMLQNDIRDPDTVGRYGGEEFLLVLPNTRLMQGAEQATRLCQYIRETDIEVGENLRLTVSMGIAEYKNGQENWQRLLSRADKALYESKNSGRDRWTVSE